MVYKYILSIALALSAGPSAFADDAPADSASNSCDLNTLTKTKVGDCQSLVKECGEAGTDAETKKAAGGAFVQILSKQQSTQDAQAQMQSTMKDAGIQLAAAAKTCSDDVQQCKTKCAKNKADEQKCEQTLKSLAQCYGADGDAASKAAASYQTSNTSTAASPQSVGGADTSSASTGSPSGSGTTGTGSSTGSNSGGGSSSSGMGSTMQQMLPMVAMLGLAAMTANSGSSAAATATTNPNEALQANGQLDCSKLDGYVYRPCESILSAKCTTEITANTYLSDQTCLNYSGYYCASTGAAPSAVMVDTSSGLPSIASAGEGSTSTYCAQVKAVNFCQIAGNALCPSCVQLSKIQSTTCQNNSTACLGQSSTAATTVSMQNSCPGGDPAVSTALTAASVATAPTTAIISPASLKAQSVMAGGMNAMSVNSIPSDVATREGLASSGAAVQTYAGGSNARSLASTSGSIQVASVSSSGNRASVASSGPATDVQGEYGSNLFNMGSQVYRQRCAAGKLNNCP